MSSSNHLPHFIFGAGRIGGNARSFTFTWDSPAKVSSLLLILDDLGVKELDSAASYPPTNPGNTETLLGQSGAASRGFTIDSKIANHTPDPILDDERIDDSIETTLTRLRVPRVRTLYAHQIDTLTPLEETAAAFDRHYREGKFEQLGLSNFPIEQVRQYFAICERHSYIKPTVYQGHYNAIIRGHEKELLPLLREQGCVYNAFSPLGGGFLTELHTALRKLAAACEAHDPSLSLAKVCLRWIVHHSALRKGDGIILGAKTEDQLVRNVRAAKKGPLPKKLQDVVEDMWSAVKHVEQDTENWM